MKSIGRGKITNLPSIRNKVARSRKYQMHIRRILKLKVALLRKKILSDFNKHPVTKEMERGVYADNVSGLLSGYGNLFSYIGFYHSAKPVGALRRLIMQIRLLKITRSARTMGRLMINSAIIRYPDEADILNVSKMPWEPRSWVYGIERGIDGSGYYMKTRFKGGRSKHGLQAKH